MLKGMIGKLENPEQQEAEVFDIAALTNSILNK